MKIMTFVLLGSIATPFSHIRVSVCEGSTCAFTSRFVSVCSRSRIVLQTCANIFYVSFLVTSTGDKKGRQTSRTFATLNEPCSEFTAKTKGMLSKERPEGPQQNITTNLFMDKEK